MRRRSANRATRASFAWMRGLLTAFLLTTFSASLLHYVVVAHAQCAAHGELAHASHDRDSHAEHAWVGAKGDADQLAARTGSGEHDDHCQSSGVLPCLAPDVSAAALSQYLSPYALLERPAAMAVDARRDLYRLAPKQSPPA